MIILLKEQSDGLRGFVDEFRCRIERDNFFETYNFDPFTSKIDYIIRSTSDLMYQIQEHLDEKGLDFPSEKRERILNVIRNLCSKITDTLRPFEEDPLRPFRCYSIDNLENDYENAWKEIIDLVEDGLVETDPVFGSTVFKAWNFLLSQIEGAIEAVTTIFFGDTPIVSDAIESGAKFLADLILDEIWEQVVKPKVLEKLGEDATLFEIIQEISNDPEVKKYLDSLTCNISALEAKHFHETYLPSNPQPCQFATERLIRRIKTRIMTISPDTCGLLSGELPNISDPRTEVQELENQYYDEFCPHRSIYRDFPFSN